MSNVVYKEIKGKRSFFGKIVKLLFILFNLLMVFWIFGGISGSAESIEALEGSQKTAAAAGAGLGVFILMVIWTLGDIILGILVLLTRPARAMIVEQNK